MDAKLRGFNQMRSCPQQQLPISIIVSSAWRRRLSWIFFFLFILFASTFDDTSANADEELSNVDPESLELTRSNTKQRSSYSSHSYFEEASGGETSIEQLYEDVYTKSLKNDNGNERNEAGELVTGALNFSVVVQNDENQLHSVRQKSEFPLTHFFLDEGDTSEVSCAKGDTLKPSIALASADNSVRTDNYLKRDTLREMSNFFKRTSDLLDLDSSRSLISISSVVSDKIKASSTKYEKELKEGSSNSVDVGSSVLYPLFDPRLQSVVANYSGIESIENELQLVGSSSEKYQNNIPVLSLDIFSLFGEGRDLILSPTTAVLEGISRTVDRVRGFILKTARNLPNTKRNVIVSYREFKPFMLLDMFAKRSSFLQQLANLFNSIQPLKSIYLRHLGMEIFELPDILGMGEFIHNTMRLSQFVDAVFEDGEIVDFDQEKQFKNAENIDIASFVPNESKIEKFERLIDSENENSKNKRGERKLQDINKSSEVPPNDPMIWKQWAIIDSGDNQWGTEVIKAWHQWTGPTNGEKITIAVIDSGVDYNHPDLKANIWRNRDEICNNGKDDDMNGLVDDCLGWDFINGDNDPMDDNGHGTASAGIIAAEANNRNGLAGICWGCEIMAIKALNSEIRGSISSFVRAIDYAIGKGVKISNNSYGGRGSGFKGLLHAVERAKAAGMIFVAAAGNYNGNNDNDKDPVYPSSYPLDNVISVAAISRNGHLASFSSYGRKNVDIAAPGSQILATHLDGTYRQVDGTSFAVPFVTGTVALIWSRFPHIPYQQVIDRILRNAKPNPFLQGYISSGGVLNIWKAVTDGAESLPKPETSLSQHGSNKCLQLLSCGRDAECIETELSFICRCLPGFQGNPRKGIPCTDINECLFNPCGPASRCINTIGSFECRCNRGFRQVGDHCIDIDECSESSLGGKTNVCPIQAICQNFSGTFDCICPPLSVWNARSGKEAACLIMHIPATGPCANNGDCGMNSLCQASSSLWYYQSNCNCLEGYTPINALTSSPSLLTSEMKQTCVREGLLESEITTYLKIVKTTVSKFKVTPSIHVPATSINTVQSPTGLLRPRGTIPPSCFLGICLLGSSDTSHGNE